MKTLRRITAMVLAIVMALGVNIVGTWADDEVSALSPKISRITVDSAPTKTAYAEGEKFDPTGSIITLTYDDNSTETIKDGNIPDKLKDYVYFGFVVDFSYQQTSSATNTTVLTPFEDFIDNGENFTRYSKYYDKYQGILNYIKSTDSNYVADSLSQKSASYIIFAFCNFGIDKEAFDYKLKGNNYSVGTGNYALSYKSIGTISAYTLTDITVTTPPKKTLYIEGEKFNPTGMVVTGTYSYKNLTLNRKITNYTIDKTTALNVADKVVTITYRDKSTTTPITVVDKFLTGIEISTPPTKTSYVEGEVFDKTGMVVKAVYSDGTKEEIADYTVDTNALAKGTTSMYVTKNGFFATVPISVTAKELVSIKVTTSPTKTSYVEGEIFNPNGMVVTGTYNNGSTGVLAPSEYTITPNMALKTSDKTITVTAGDKSATTPITVTAKSLTSIAVTTQPNKTSYIAGQSFDKTGMVVTGYYSDGSTAVITDYTVSPTTLSSDTKTVTVTKNGKTASVAVNVVAKAITSIKVTTPPTKTSYIEGEKFNKAGMVVTGYYNDGTSKTITDYVVDTNTLSVTTDKVYITYENMFATTPVTVTAKTPDKTLTGVEVSTPPTKTSYVEGEVFDRTGMVVKAVYSDGTKEEIADYTVDTNALAKGTTSMYVTKNGFFATVPISVTAKELVSIKVTTSPTKTSYVEGEIFNPNGMVVTGTYNNGSTGVLAPSEYTITPNMALKTSDKTITVTAGDKSATTPITVTAKSLTSIAVTTQPNKTSYIAGQSFDKTGMVVTGYYSDGSTAVITDYTVSPTTLSSDTKTVTVTKNGKTASVAVNVVAKAITSIKVTTPPTKTSYIEGEKFNKAGMVVTGYYNDGTSKTITDYVVDTNTLSVTTDKVYITYENMFATTPVTVTAKELVSIKVTTPPTKTNYVVGQIFDPAGMVVTGTYNDGSTAVINDYTYTPNVAFGYVSNAFTITVKKDGKTATTKVKVVQKSLGSLEITAKPKKTIYEEGEKFDPTGMVVTAVYNDGTKSGCDYTYSPMGELKPSDKYITIKAMGKTVDVDITVYPVVNVPYKVNGNTLSYNFTDYAGRLSSIPSDKAAYKEILNENYNSSLNYLDITENGLYTKFLDVLKVVMPLDSAFKVKPGIDTGIYTVSGHMSYTIPNDTGGGQQILKIGNLTFKSYSRYAYDAYDPHRDNYGQFGLSVDSLNKDEDNKEVFTPKIDILSDKLDFDYVIKINLDTQTATLNITCNNKTLSTEGIHLPSREFNKIIANPNFRHNKHLKNFVLGDITVNWDKETSSYKDITVPYKVKDNTLTYDFSKYAGKGRLRAKSSKSAAFANILDNVNYVDMTSNGAKLNDASTSDELTMTMPLADKFKKTPGLDTGYLNISGTITPFEAASKWSILSFGGLSIKTGEGTGDAETQVGKNYCLYDSSLNVFLGDTGVKCTDEKTVPYSITIDLHNKKAELIVDGKSTGIVSFMSTTEIENLLARTSKSSKRAVTLGDITVSYSTSKAISLEIITPPVKTEYVKGEKFDPTGMVVQATYEDGRKEIINDYTFAPADELDLSDNIITVSKDGASATTPITVVDKILTGIKVTTPPDKVNYVEGEKFDPTGMIVTGTYNDGSTAVINDYTYTPADSLEAGVKEIVVSKNGFSDTVAIHLFVKDLSTYVPSKNGDVNRDGVVDNIDATILTEVLQNIITDYNSKAVHTGDVDGDGSLTTDDAKLIRNYLKGIINLSDTAKINADIDGDGDITEYDAVLIDKAVLGMWSLQTVYEDNADANDDGSIDMLDVIWILNAYYERTTIDHIEIVTPPDKVDYIEGQPFDPTGMVVEAVFKDGRREEVTDYIVPVRPLTPEDSSIKVKYEEFEADQSINVIKRIPVSAEIVTPPDKVKYVEGEKFDPNGIDVKVTYNDGSEEHKNADDIKYSDKDLTTDDKTVTITVDGIDVDVDITVSKKETTTETTTESTTEVTTEVTTETTTESTTEMTTTTESTTKKDNSNSGGNGGHHVYPGTISDETTETSTSVSNNSNKEENTENSTEVTTDNRFKDVIGTWAEKYIEHLHDLGIVNGITKDLFAPNDSTKRGDFALVLSRLLNLNVDTVANYSDVDKDSYYSKAISAVTAENLMIGYGDGTFKPEQAITREEMMVIIAKLAKNNNIINYNFESSDYSELNKYNDGELVSWWARPYVCALSQAGMVVGDNGNLKPNDNITRAEMSVIVDKYISK